MRRNIYTEQFTKKKTPRWEEPTGLMDSVPLPGTAWQPQSLFKGPSPSPEGSQQFCPPCHKLWALKCGTVWMVTWQCGHNGLSTSSRRCFCSAVQTRSAGRRRTAKRC